jgi:hypothetical protein
MLRHFLAIDRVGKLLKIGDNGQEAVVLGGRGAFFGLNHLDAIQRIVRLPDDEGYVGVAMESKNL